MTSFTTACDAFYQVSKRQALGREGLDMRLGLHISRSVHGLVYITQILKPAVTVPAL